MEATWAPTDSWRSYRWAAAYVASIVLVNVLFGSGPMWALVANFVVGAGFLVRDVAQRDIGDRVLGATALGIALSFVMAPAGIAAPSALAFGLSETLDWGVVRRMHARPLWQKMLISHFASVPLDSGVFLLGIAMHWSAGPIQFGIGAPWSWQGFAVMTGLKFAAIVGIFFARR